MTFKLTYSTMFDPPEEMHTRFEAALAEVRARLGATHAMHVGGRDVTATRTYEKRSPVDRRLVLGHFPLGETGDVDRAMAAAKEAFPRWRATPPAERVRLVRRVSALLEERVYAIGAAVALEVGKNRMEALGETQETADFFSGYAAELERNEFYDRALPDDPLAGFRSHNRTVLKPYGVWAVITPFNFPLALAGGPVAAALVTGNTVVLKGATDTPWAGRLLADCRPRRGLPRRRLQLRHGPGPRRGRGPRRPRRPRRRDLHRLLRRRHGPLPPDGERRPSPPLHRRDGREERLRGDRARRPRARGHRHRALRLRPHGAEVLRPLAGVREEGVADALLARVLQKTAAIRVGDPCMRENWMGPVINEGAAEGFERYCTRLREGGGRILAGGTRIQDGDLAHGHFVAPTVAEAPRDHPLFREEMFQPILMVARVKDLREGIARANDSALGLTAGCYGNDDEVRTFLDQIEAGVTYVNRPQGATTGAWPGYQAFGGWKGSGSTGKAIGSLYYLPLYLREQSQTVVE